LTLGLNEEEIKVGLKLPKRYFGICICNYLRFGAVADKIAFLVTRKGLANRVKSGFFRLMKKVSVFSLYLLDKAKQNTPALQLGTAWAQKPDNRNTKKGQNSTFAGEQQEGKKNK